MGSWYLIANKTKKEKLFTGCIEGLSLNERSYRNGLGRLLIYLLDTSSRLDTRDKERFNPYNFENKDNIFFAGHWAGDEIYFVNDGGCIIDSSDDDYCEGLYEAADYFYTDITYPAAKEYNYWNEYHPEDQYKITDNRYDKYADYAGPYNYLDYDKVVEKEEYSEKKRNSGDYDWFPRTPILFKKGDKVTIENCVASIDVGHSKFNIMGKVIQALGESIVKDKDKEGNEENDKN